jgi:glutaredoxin 3
VSLDLARSEKELALIIYTKPDCPYCAKAKEHYQSRGIEFDERNAQDNLKYRAEMLAYSDGDPTVPVIVEDGVFKQQGWEGRG